MTEYHTIATKKSPHMKRGKKRKIINVVLNFIFKQTETMEGEQFYIKKKKGKKKPRKNEKKEEEGNE